MALHPIYSIFSQIEAAAAEQMIAEGRANRIDAAFIPESVRVNANGQTALFAIALRPTAARRFEKLIRDLRA